MSTHQRHHHHHHHHHNYIVLQLKLAIIITILTLQLLIVTTKATVPETTSTSTTGVSNMEHGLHQDLHFDDQDYRNIHLEIRTPSSVSASASTSTSAQHISSSSRTGTNTNTNTNINKFKKETSNVHPNLRRDSHNHNHDHSHNHKHSHAHIHNQSHDHSHDHIHNQNHDHSHNHNHDHSHSHNHNHESKSASESSSTSTQTQSQSNRHKRILLDKGSTRKNKQKEGNEVNTKEQRQQSQQQKSRKTQTYHTTSASASDSASDSASTINSHFVKDWTIDNKIKLKQENENGIKRNLQMRQVVGRQQKHIPSDTIGWTPSTYPNPIQSPDICHIPNDFRKQQVAYQTGTGKDTDADTDININTTDTETRFRSEFPLPQQHRNLLLCDPDETLSDDDLQSIGNALINFSTHYAYNSYASSSASASQQHGLSGYGYGSSATSNGCARNRSTSSSSSSKRSIKIQPESKSSIDDTSSRPDTIGLSRDWVHDKISGTTFDIDNNIGIDIDIDLPTFDLDNNNNNDIETNGKVSSFGGSFLPSNAYVNDNDNDNNNGNENKHGHQHGRSKKMRIEIGVAVTNQLDISAILHEFRYYTFEDEDTMTDDAAQFFASFLHNRWFSKNSNSHNGNSNNYNNGFGDVYGSDIQSVSSSENCDDEGMEGVNGILIFLSVEDRVCFISSGNSISSILPWWRLERVVNGMKQNLRTMNYSDAIIGAIDDISQMIDNGPPTIGEKVHDFSVRFGLVFIFSICTFILAVCGEVRERQRRYEIAEISTVLSDVEEEKARMLQQSYKTDCCPICLEEFSTQDNNNSLNKTNNDNDSTYKEFDKYGIPLLGTDGKPLKILRCGHVFDVTCWRAWVHSGNGNPYCCPVCRKDIRSERDIRAEEHSVENDISTPLVPQSTLNHQTYGTAATVNHSEGDHFVNNDEALIP